MSRHPTGRVGRLSAVAMVLVAWCLVAVPAGAEETAGPPAPLAKLTDAETAVLAALPEDPPPKVLNAILKDYENAHFLTCDEWRLHLLEPHLRGLGGGLAGVGTDQIYLFAGWMRPVMVFPTDYDPWVVRLHRAYLAFFDASADVASFRRLWTAKGASEAAGLIERRYGTEAAPIVAVYRSARAQVERRLARVEKILAKDKVASYLDDPAQYQWVRSLVQAGRVRPLQANLLGKQGFPALGQASRSLGIPLRALYLSNAEEYWLYGDDFRRNMEAQYFDEKSVVLRTSASKPANGDYRYSVQAGLLFQKALKKPGVRRVGDHVPRPAVKGQNHFPVTVLPDV